jgi:methyl-accepting chemotaxis protein
MAENSARNSALLEETAAQLSQISAIILRGAGNGSDTCDTLAEISALVSRSSEILGEIDTNICLYTSAASDVSAEALQLSGKADELIAATGELSALIDGAEPPDYREFSLKNKLARQMLVKALPLADIS